MTRQALIEQRESVKSAAARAHDNYMASLRQWVRLNELLKEVDQALGETTSSQPLPPNVIVFSAKRAARHARQSR